MKDNKKYLKIQQYMFVITNDSIESYSLAKFNDKIVFINI